MQAKRENDCSKIELESGDSKALFQTAKGLMQMSKTQKLPTYKDPQEMANRFEIYFVEKVQNIRKNLVAGNTSVCDPHQYDVACDVRLEDLALTNHNLISRV